MQSFKHTGPIISMVNTAVIDSLSFLLLGIPIIFGYAAAFAVLFNDRFINDEGEHFATLPRAFETLTYAGVGNFEVDVRRHTAAAISWTLDVMCLCRCFDSRKANLSSGRIFCSVLSSSSLP